MRFETESYDAGRRGRSIREWTVPETPASHHPIDVPRSQSAGGMIVVNFVTTIGDTADVGTIHSATVEKYTY